jgi:hypothetical protein
MLRGVVNRMSLHRTLGPASSALLGPQQGVLFRSPAPPQSMKFSSDIQLDSFRGTLSYPYDSSPMMRLPATLAMTGASVAQTLHETVAQVETSLRDIFHQTIRQMSSTLKKRKAKMNKHKLRKRRKLLRRKAK